MKKTVLFLVNCSKFFQDPGGVSSPKFSIGGNPAPTPPWPQKSPSSPHQIRPRKSSVFPNEIFLVIALLIMLLRYCDSVRKCFLNIQVVFQIFCILILLKMFLNVYLKHLIWLSLHCISWFLGYI